MLKQLIKEKINDKILSENLKTFAESYKISKEKAYQGLNFEKIRTKINNIKDLSYEEIINLYNKFKENALKKGCYVYEAATAEDANNYILEVCKKHNTDIIVKSKSMTSEEIKLNEFLEKNGITPIETDLGEWILQLAGETPSHMVMPAIHKSRKQVAKLFKKVTGNKIDENDIEAMVKIARKQLRDYYFKAKVGITGANVAVAETATIGIVTNEGNARLSTTIPDVHIVILGYEKLINTFKDALQIIRALPKSATGQIISTYVTWISGSYPAKNDKNKEVHFVFLDNGRLPLFKNKNLKEALKCIRCGSCANVCPVYEIIGGHVFGDTYVGAIGLILTSFYGDEKKANEILKLCIGCKTCSVNCPTGIDLQSLISDINATITPKYGLSLPKKAVYSYVMPNPALFKTITKIGKYLQRPLLKNEKIEKIPFMGKEKNFRALPSIAPKSFTALYKDFYSSKPSKKYKKSVTFYSGCAIEYFYPEMGLTLLKLLDRANIKVNIPEKMVCCGLPAIHAGDGENGKKTIIKNLKYFDEKITEDIITLCPSCGMAIKEEFPKYTINSPQDYKKSEKMANKVKSLSQFLAENRLELKYTAKYKVTYHTPCHQKRGLCFSTENFLQEILKDYFIPLKNSDACCGFGGSFSFDFAEISSKILENKINNIKNTNAEILLTDCPGCIMQIEGGLINKGINVKVMHVSQFLENYTTLVAL
ncbi:L-lactate dehydrogenase (quinone) large subunit LdhH [Deferribacter abyssi]|uniref:L-lactate dehydrogenase (quinone) large subunit LdhH n=1 Tax=Deferribacter abyssi TaxID=213806 RepID=UPI003C2AA51F